MRVRVRACVCLCGWVYVCVGSRTKSPAALISMGAFTASAQGDRVLYGLTF